MCVRVLGDVSRLEPDMRESIRELEEVTKNNTGLHFQVALNYGSRDEMLRGMRIIAEKVEKWENVNQKRSRKKCFQKVWIQREFRIRIC